MPVIKCTNYKCDYFQVGEPDNCSKPLHLIAECPEAVVGKTSSFAKASTFTKVTADGSEDREGGGQKTEVRSQRSEVRNDKAFYVVMLKSEQCLCERGKKPGNAFCFRCYKSLPRDIQKELYKPVGRGFEAGYEEATKYLQENIW